MGDFKAYEKDWDVRELEIPIDEMVHEYRMSKDKKKQIDILAEQCGTKPCRIAWILNRCGLAVDPKKMPRALRSEGSFDYVAHWESSEDAVVCDRLRKQIQDAQSMPEFDAQDSVAEEKDMNKMFESEEKIIERLEAEAAADIEENREDNEPEPYMSQADLRREILTDAEACVCTDRNLMYGEAEDNFGMISRFWSAYLGISVTEYDVINMMILFKTARLATAEKPSRDSYVDIAGYAACAGGMMK